MKIDYMHPLVLLQDEIDRRVNELGQIRRNLTEAQEKFKTFSIKKLK